MFLPIPKIQSVSSLMLSICISHSALLFFFLLPYSLLHQPSRLKVFHLSLPFFHPCGWFFLLHVFHFHSSHSFQSRFPLLSDRIWTLLQAMLYEMIFSATSSWESIALMILHVNQIKSLKHKWPVVQSKPYVAVIILHTLVSPFHCAYRTYRHCT